MARSPVLDPSKGYTFSQYFELNADPVEVFAELGLTLQKRLLELPTVPSRPDFLPNLERQLLQTLELVDLTSEMARRETLIAPILLAVCAHTRQPLKIEYAIAVNQWLRGTVDYFIPGNPTLLVIEAKQADLARGFVQLGAELVALDQWTTEATPLLYGAVTTGDVWRFGCLHRAERVLVQDIGLYTVPNDLHRLVGILLGIVSNDEMSKE